MERTTGHKISTLASYLRIPRNDLDNVDRQTNSLLGLIVKSCVHGNSGVYKRAEFLVFPTPGPSHRFDLDRALRVEGKEYLRSKSPRSTSVDLLSLGLEFFFF
jgi:hypothetical protein